MIAAATLPLSGCTILGGEEAPALPKPSLERCAPDELNAEQQARQNEVDRFLATWYQESGWVILATKQTRSCDVIDYLDPASVPGSEIEAPPDPVYELPPEVMAQGTEIDDDYDAQGLAWSVPVIRPRFAPYVFGEVPAASLSAFIRQTVPGAPGSSARLYAGVALPVQNTGARTFVNPYDGKVDAFGTNILEMAILCPGPDRDKTLDMVGVMASRDRANFELTVPSTRLQVEFLTAGDRAIGPGIGGIEGAVMKAGVYIGQKTTGFIGRAGAPYAPGAVLTPVSTVGGAIYESRFEIQLFGGNWWIAHNGNWLGYYPREGLDQIEFSACEAHWYGEVRDRNTETWDVTDMGSGEFAAEGLGRAAHFRLPQYLDAFAAPQWPDAALPSEPNNPLCYTSSGLQDESATLGPQFQRILYVGGPGGDSPGCTYP
ncbi:neprosin family prolyl endopeptidase [Polyangium spumosum]|uniref:neprosin family prolyl endopeptidase n=1 Tax=Polyangium spumosum TaxID=889282 RepID=UPI0014795039|nr:neprosin family prolyl endopeptidase [Polyangium spumosum]